MKKFLKCLVFAALFAAISLGCGFYYVATSFNKGIIDETENNPPEVDDFIKGERHNIVVFGVDEGTIGAGDRYNRYRSDTIIIFSIDKKNKDVKAFSIPRDTRVHIDKVGTDKINAAMAYGGLDLAISTVKDFLNIPIHNYVVVNLEGFRDIVDAVGGVEIDVDQPLKYKDRAQNLFIDIRPGLQVLNGEQAEGYVRYRQYPRGDIDRIVAQQKFIKAFAKTLLKPSTLLKLPKIIDVVQKSIDTDITPLQMASLANLARQLKTEDISLYTIPGEGKYISGVSYYIPHVAKMNELVDQIFYSGKDIKVAVLNGNGTQGVASKVAKKLESEGFKVVEVANADNFDYDTTTIIYPKGNKDDAEKLAQILVTADIREETKDSSMLTTVIVGKDAY